MLRKLSVLIIFLCSFLAAKAGDTVFVGNGAKLDTFSKGNWFSINVSGMKPTTMNSSFGFESVNINGKIAEAGYLAIYIVSPNGTYFQLTNYDGATQKGFDSTFFTDTAPTPIHFGKSPFSGYYTSQSFLREINNGQDINGTWYLLISDNNPARKDVLKNWSIHFGTTPLTDVTLDSSSLPIIVVSTRGQGVPSSTSYVHFIDNSSGKYNYTRDSVKTRSYCEIGLHGNYSRDFPKLSYNIKTLDSKWNNNFDTAIVGWPAQHEWAFIANYSDRSLLRNAITQHMYSSMGQAYSPRWKHVELILDGVYQGVFLMIEKIKRGKDFVNIAKLDTSASAPSTGDSLTGGYMIKTDWKGSTGWFSKYSLPYYSWDRQYFRFYDPTVPDSFQQMYIQSYFDSFENAIYGRSISASPGNWRNFANEKSIDDYFFIQEITMNLDGYRASFYMYKDRNDRDRHIHLGPVWDFDWTMYDNGWLPNFHGWLYPLGYEASMWWFKLIGGGSYGYGKGDAAFKNELKCKWTVYRRNGLSQTSLDRFVDSNVAVLNDAQKRNFREWPEFGVTTGILAVSQPVLAPTYIREVDTLKGWIHRRLKWMDKYMFGTCNRDIDPPTVTLNGSDTVYLEVNTTYKDTGITYHDNYGDTNVTVIKGSNLDTSSLGTYVISWFLSDKAGNKANIQRIVIVIDTIAPTITLLNGDTVTTEVLVKYKDTDVVIRDNYDTSPTIKKWGTFNFINNIPDTLGYYTMWYKATDQSGNVDSAVKVIHVVDTKAPLVWFSGHDTVKLEVYDTYSDSDVHIKDNYDTNAILTYSGNLKNFKTDSIGYFTLWYKGTDHSGNKDSIRRTIYVVDSLAPSISLVGNDSVFLSVNDSVQYIDSGYIATDNYDKHLKIDTAGTYSGTKNAGTFFITYQAIDQSANKSSKVSRIITVALAKDTSAGIENANALSGSISIYPNPGSGIFYISVKLKSNSKAYLNVYDEMGTEIVGLRRDVTHGWGGILHFENEPAGIYILKLQTENGSLTRRLILIK